MIPEHYHIRKWLDDPIRFLTVYYKDIRDDTDTWFPFIVKADDLRLFITSKIGENKITDLYVPEGIEVLNCTFQSHLKRVTLPISIELVACDAQLEIDNLNEIMRVNPDVEIYMRSKDFVNGNDLTFFNNQRFVL